MTFCLHKNIPDFHLGLCVMIWFPIAWMAFVSAFTHPTWVFTIWHPCPPQFTWFTWLMVNLDLNLILKVDQQTIKHGPHTPDPGSISKRFLPCIVRGFWLSRWRWRFCPPQLTGWPTGLWKRAATESIDEARVLGEGSSPWLAGRGPQGKRRGESRGEGNSSQPSSSWRRRRWWQGWQWLRWKYREKEKTRRGLNWPSIPPGFYRMLQYHRFPAPSPPESSPSTLFSTVQSNVLNCKRLNNWLQMSQICPIMTQDDWQWPRMTYQGSGEHRGVQGGARGH